MALNFDISDGAAQAANGAAGAAGNTTSLAGLDSRFWKLPDKLGDDRSRWNDWKFDMENLLCLTEASFLDDLRTGERDANRLNDTGSDHLRNKSLKLYAVLCQTTKEKAKQIVRAEQQTRNGFECWRQLVAEYEPQSEGRKLMMNLAISRADELKDTTDLRRWVQGLNAWEEKIREYERLPAIASGEAELRALSRAACLGLYVKAILKDLGVPDAKVRLACDASAALGAAKNLNASRMRHLNIADKFIRKCKRDKLVTTCKVKTDEQKADLYTKHVSKETLAKLGTRFQDVSHLPAIEAKFKKINSVEEIENSDEIVAAYKAARTAATEAEGIARFSRGAVGGVLVATLPTLAKASDTGVVEYEVNVPAVAIASFLLGMAFMWFLMALKDCCCRKQVMPETPPEAPPASPEEPLTRVVRERTETVRETFMTPTPGSPEPEIEPEELPTRTSNFRSRAPTRELPQSVYFTAGGQVVHARRNCSSLTSRSRLHPIEERRMCRLCCP